MSQEDIPTWVVFFLMCLFLTIFTTVVIIREKEQVLRANRPISS